MTCASRTAPCGCSGGYAQDAGTLEVGLRAGGKAPLTVGHLAVLGRPAVLSLRLGEQRPPAPGSTVPVLAAPRLCGQFARVEVDSAGLRAVPVYTSEGLSVRLVRR